MKQFKNFIIKLFSINQTNKEPLKIGDLDDEGNVILDIQEVDLGLI